MLKIKFILLIKVLDEVKAFERIHNVPLSTTAKPSYQPAVYDILNSYNKYGFTEYKENPIKLEVAGKNYSPNTIQSISFEAIPR